MRHALPTLQSPPHPKSGLSRHKRQRWMCMGCRRTFGDKDLRLIDPKIKEFALAMYAEGIAARKI
jgi:transposase-like protein